MQRLRDFLLALMISMGVLFGSIAYFDPCFDLALVGWIFGIVCAATAVAIGLCVPDPTEEND